MVCFLSPAPRRAGETLESHTGEGPRRPLPALKPCPSGRIHPWGLRVTRQEGARSRMLGPHRGGTNATTAPQGRGGAAADGAEKRPRAELRADPPPRRSQTRTQRRGRPRPCRGRSPIGGGSEPIVDSGRLRSLRWSPPIGPRAAPAFAYFVARK